MLGTVRTCPPHRPLPFDPSTATIEQSIGEAAVSGGPLPDSSTKRRQQPYHAAAKRQKERDETMSFETLLAGKTPKSALHEYFQLQGGKPVFELLPGAPPPETPSFTCKLTIPDVARGRSDGLPSQSVFTGVARTKKGAEHLASDAAMRYISAIPPKSVSSSPSGMAPVNFVPASSPMNSRPSSSPGPQYQPPPHFQTPPQKAASPDPNYGGASPTPYSGDLAVTDPALNYSLSEEAPPDISDEELTTTINAMSLEDMRPLVLQAHKEMRLLKSREQKMQAQLGAYAKQLGAYSKWHRDARAILMQDPLSAN